MKRLCLALALCAASGCGERTLRWHFSVDPSLEASAVVARVRSDGCDGAIVYEEHFARGAEAMRPPPLDRGRYAFEIEVRDDACAIVGAGCEERDLPLEGDDVVHVAVAPLSRPRPACQGGDRCVAGRCEGGLVDAGPDGARGDAAVACDCEEPTDLCEAGRCVPLVRARTVRMGVGFGCAIGEARDGGATHIYCWGDGRVGRFGNGCGEMAATAPVTVTFGDPADELTWTEIEVAGHTCVRASEGSIYCWGGNHFGQAGPAPSGCSGNQFVPTEIPAPAGASWADVAVADVTTCAITDDGRRYCFGRSDQNRFGGASDAPDGGTSAVAHIDDGHQWSSLIGGANGNFYGFVGGEAWFYGWNDAGQTAPSGGQPSVPQRLGGGFESFALGRGYGCQIDTSGRLSCWGCSGNRAFDDYFGCQLGALGLGVEHRDPEMLTPDQPGTARTAVELSDVTSAGAHDWTCAVAEGRLYCWGPYNEGALGVGPLEAGSLPEGCDEDDGGAIFCATPQPVASSATDWLEVDVGSTQSCAIRDGGRLYCWGWPLGDRASAPITEPTRMILH